MKKIILLLLLSILLISCWNNTTTTTTNSLTPYSWNNFSINIPISWIVTDLSWSTLPSPKDWIIEAVVSSKDTKDWFINNLVILSKELEVETTSLLFAQKNNPKNYSGYESYTELSSWDFDFYDWEKSMLYVFEAKYNKDNWNLKFLQTSRVCDWKKTFFLTIWLSLNINDTAKYEEMLKSFECK